MNHRTPQGQHLRAVMVDHDRGPEYALVECIAPGCTQIHRIENSQPLSTNQLTELITGLGWSIQPTLCPEHAKSDSGVAWVLIERQDHDDAALIYATRELALEALEESLLVDSLCEEDCLDAWVPDEISAKDLHGYEVIIPD